MAKRADASAGTPATVALTRAGVPFIVRAYEHDPRAAAYGLEAAEKLGIDPDRVFKTLLANVDGGLAVGIVPVAQQLDLKALAQALGGSWRPFVPGYTFRDRGYSIRQLTPSAGAPRTLSVHGFQAYAFDASSA